MVIKNRCILVLWTKVTSALEGLIQQNNRLLEISIRFQYNTLGHGHVLQPRYYGWGKLKRGRWFCTVLRKCYMFSYIH